MKPLDKFELRKVKSHPLFPKFISWCENVELKDPIHHERLEAIWENWLRKHVKIHPVSDKRDYYREEYLKTDHWNTLKASKLALFNACQACGSKNNLDVHHRHYRQLYDVKLYDLAVLCRRCHNFIHAVNPVGATAHEREEFVDQRLLKIMHVHPKFEDLRGRFHAIANKMGLAARLRHRLTCDKNLLRLSLIRQGV